MARLEPEPAADRSRLEEVIGYRFGDPGLLDQALVHRSYVAEHPGTQSNERLEFLGDAVLGVVVADLAYRRFGDLNEGLLSEMRKQVVNTTILAEVAAEFDLGEHVRLGRGEDGGGGRTKASILADACEAVIGAVYLDGGLEAAYPLVERMVGHRLEVAHIAPTDHKTALQELCSRIGLGPPAYASISVGPDHDKRFTAEVRIDGQQRGRGDGRSKKEAEQAAAAQAISALNDPGSDA